MVQKFDRGFAAYPLRDILNGWYFRLDEISYGYYRLTGIDQWGKSVSRDGNDPDELLQTCKKDALEMSSKVGK